MRNAALQCPKSPDNAVPHEWSGHSESLATESNPSRIWHDESDFRPSLCQGEKDSPDARYGGARTVGFVGTRSPHVGLSAMVPAFAEPDIHSLSQILADRHRRLSVCSLPVLKQFGESLGSLISVAQSATAEPGSLRAV